MIEVDAARVTEARRRAQTGLRRAIHPLFRSLGFAKFSATRIERSDGADPLLPDRYFNLFIEHAPAAMLDGKALRFLVELTVHYPALMHPRLQPPQSAAKGFRPAMRDLTSGRHSLMLSGPDGPHWTCGTLAEVDDLCDALAAAITAHLAPAIARLGHPGIEAERERDSGLITPQDIRAHVKRSPAQQSSRSMPAGPVQWTTKCPVLFHSPHFRRPARREDWRDPAVSELIRRSHSLHFTATAAAHFGLQDDATTFRALARDLEDAAAVPLVPVTDSDVLGPPTLVRLS